MYDGIIFESRIGRIIGHILYCLLVIAVPVVEFAIAFSTYGDLSGYNGGNKALVFISVSIFCLFLNYIGRITNIPILSWLLRFIFTIIFITGVSFSLLDLFLQVFESDEWSPMSSFEQAKMAGYIGFLFFAYVFQSTINCKYLEYLEEEFDAETYEYQNFRWILLFVGMFAVIPLSLLLENIINPIYLLIIFGFYVGLSISFLLFSKAKISIISYIFMLVLLLVSVITSCVFIGQGRYVIGNSCFVTYGFLVFALLVTVFINERRRMRDRAGLGENEIFMNFIYPIILLALGVGLGCLSFIAPWVLAISIPLSMLIIYVILKYTIFPNETEAEQREREDRMSDGHSYSVSGNSNYEIVDSICNAISYGDLTCISNGFYAKTQATISHCNDNTFDIRVSYDIYYYPEYDSSRSPSPSEDRDLRNQAYRHAKNYFNKYSNRLTPPYHINFEY